MKLFRSLAGLFSLCVPLLATGQSVVQGADSTLQPQIARDENGFRACGVRAVVIQENDDTLDFHDFSVYINHQLQSGRVKAGKSRATKAMVQQDDTSKMTVVTPGPVKFWIAREAKSKFVIAKDIRHSEDSPGYILRSTEIDLTIDLLKAMIEGERIQFSSMYKGQKLETIISFAGQLAEHERTALWACMMGLAEATGGKK